MAVVGCIVKSFVLVFLKSSHSLLNPRLDIKFQLSMSTIFEMSGAEIDSVCVCRKRHPPPLLIGRGEWFYVNTVLCFFLM